MEVDEPQPELDAQNQMEPTDMEQPPVLQQRAPKQIPNDGEEETDEDGSYSGGEEENKRSVPIATIDMTIKDKEEGKNPTDK